MSGARESSRWRFLLSPKWLGWHVFAILAVVFWVKTIRDEVRPPAQAEPRDAVALPGGIPVPPPGGARTAGGDEEPGEDDEELAAYNAYLARLTKEVRGHG